MIDDSSVTLETLRTRLRAVGLTLERSVDELGRTAGFRVVDDRTGDVLVSGVRDEDELRNQVWWLLRGRTGGSAAKPPEAPAPTLCQSCGSPRIGNFRYCLSCGADHESWKAGPGADQGRNVLAPTAARGLAPRRGRRRWIAGLGAARRSPTLDGARTATRATGRDAPARTGTTARASRSGVRWGRAGRCRRPHRRSDRRRRQRVDGPDPLLTALGPPARFQAEPAIGRVDGTFGRLTARGSLGTLRPIDPCTGGTP